MNRTNPRYRFGIVVPVRKMAAELSGAIDSIISQKLNGSLVNSNGRRDVDVIVVVDDLDESTSSVLQRYVGHLRWVEGDAAGQAGAVVKGMNLLNAEIVKWLNADDRLLPGALQAVDQAFVASSTAEFAYGDVAFANTAGRIVGEHREPGYSPFIVLFGHNLFADPSCFWRSSLNERIGGISISAKYSLDYEFWVRIVKARGRVIQIRQTLAAFTVTGANMSVIHHKAMRREHFDILSQHYHFINILPKSARYAVLSLLMLVARVVKRARVLVERGQLSGGVFSRLMKGAGAPRA